MTGTKQTAESDTELTIHDGDGQEILLIGNHTDAVREELLDEGVLVIDVDETCPVSIVRHFEPQCIVVVAPLNEPRFATEVVKHYFGKVPIVGVNDTNEILYDAVETDQDIDAVGFYSIDDVSAAVDKIMYLAVHYNIQEETYW